MIQAKVRKGKSSKENRAGVYQANIYSLSCDRVGGNMYGIKRLMYSTEAEIDLVPNRIRVMTEKGYFLLHMDTFLQNYIVQAPAGMQTGKRYPCMCKGHIDDAYLTVLRGGGVMVKMNGVIDNQDIGYSVTGELCKGTRLTDTDFYIMYDSDGMLTATREQPEHFTMDRVKMAFMQAQKTNGVVLGTPSKRIELQEVYSLIGRLYAMGTLLIKENHSKGVQKYSLLIQNRVHVGIKIRTTDYVSVVHIHTADGKVEKATVRLTDLVGIADVVQCVLQTVTVEYHPIEVMEMQNEWLGILKERVR